MPSDAPQAAIGAERWLGWYSFGNLHLFRGM